jgi:hypothetical protein
MFPLLQLASFILILSLYYIISYYNFKIALNKRLAPLLVNLKKLIRL